MRKILVYAVLLMLICSLAACAGESAPSATAQPTALQTGANTQTNSPSAGNTLQGTQSALPSPTPTGNLPSSTISGSELSPSQSWELNSGAFGQPSLCSD